MITIFVKEYNSFSQDFYDNLINSISMNILTCSHCKHSGCLSLHAYYTRQVIIGLDQKTVLRITRVQCSFCNHTHALMPSSIIPYYQIPLKDVASAVLLHLKGFKSSTIFDHISSLDEPRLRHLIKIFIKFWKEKLESFKILLAPLEQLVKDCFANFFTQFMQISHIFNILYIDST